MRIIERGKGRRKVEESRKGMWRKVMRKCANRNEEKDCAWGKGK